MHFCLTGQYTPQALNGMMENPSTNRSEVAKKIIEAAGGKMICFFAMPADGPGVLVIFDVPEPNTTAAISGIGPGLEPKRARGFMGRQQTRTT